MSKPQESPQPPSLSPVLNAYHTGPPPFAWSQLWKPAIVNPVNLKSYTIPFFYLTDPYARAFHLSWLGFFVAFLSWFAFPPLMPEAIKQDLKLTTAEVANSNVIALTATLIVRFSVGPLVDRYGPRKVMAALLVLGAIPSGLAGVAHNPSSLYALRFFIGILGATFVPCEAWTSAFFDKNCVGTANALAAGWGNMGGGATFAIMVSLYEALRSRGLTPHVAWRASFAIVPVPVLLLVAALTLIFGPDHPAGRWSDRYNTPAAALPPSEGETEMEEVKEDPPTTTTTTVGTDTEKNVHSSTIDRAINKSLTLSDAAHILAAPITWLPALTYMTTFGLELLVDAKMADVLFGLFSKRIHGFDQKMAGYYTAIFGLMNIFTRPFGGYFGDVVYKRYGTNGKKYWTILCGVVMGATCLGGGIYLQHTGRNADLSTIMGIFSVSLIFSEFGNGANFALVPHCNPFNNGVMSGIVGSFGNLGGVVFTLIIRFQTEQGKAFWIVGLMCIVLNLSVVFIRVPKY